MLCFPSENERHVIRVCKSASATDLSGNIRLQRIVGERKRRRHRKLGASGKFLRTDPGNRVHVHHNGLASGPNHFAVGSFGFIASENDQLIRITESGIWSDSGICRTHARWIDTTILCEYG